MFSETTSMQMLGLPDDRAEKSSTPTKKPPPAETTTANHTPPARRCWSHSSELAGALSTTEGYAGSDCTPETAARKLNFHSMNQPAQAGSARMASTSPPVEERFADVLGGVLSCDALSMMGGEVEPRRLRAAHTTRKQQRAGQASGIAESASSSSSSLSLDDDGWAAVDAADAVATAAARLSPASAHLAHLVVNPDSVDHGPSRHFQMLARCARRSGGPRPVYEGFLTKQGSLVRSWRRRWCVIDERGTIRYYKPSEYIPRGIIQPQKARGDAEDAVATTVAGAGARAEKNGRSVLRGNEAARLTNWPSHVVMQNSDRIIAVPTARRTYYLYADTSEEADRWSQLISATTNG